MSVLSRARAATLAAVGALVLLQGCGSDSSTGSSGTIALSLSPTSATLQQGGSTQVTGALTRGGGFTGAVTVTVEGAPTGLSGAIAGGASVTGSSAAVTLTAASTTATGTYTLTVRAHADGLTDATATFTLTISAASAGAVTLSALPTSVTVQQGLTTNTTISVARTNFTGNVTVSAENLPAGVTASFDVSTLSPGVTGVLTLTASSTATVGAGSLLVRGTATGLTDATVSIPITVTAAPGFTIAAGTATLPVVAGSGNTTTVTATRLGGMTGAINYTVTGAVAGMTITVTPTATTDVNTLAVNATSATTPGTYPLVIHANSNGFAERTANVSVTITANPGSFTLGLVPNSQSVVQGNGATSTLTATRSGGFSGTITYTVTGQPTGVTAAVTATGTADVSTLTITTTSTVTPGSYFLIVHGNATGLTEVTTQYTLTVAAVGSASAVHLDYTTCATTARPIWVAYQDGSNSFVRVTGTGNVYDFNVTQSTVAIATVTQNGTAFTSNVRYLSKAEAASLSGACAASAVAGKTINGTVAGLGSQDNAQVSLGGITAGASQASPTFQLVNVASGLQDLIAYRRQLFALSTADRFIIRRDQNLTDGSTISPIVDFSTVEAAAPATGNLTVTSTGTSGVFAQMAYLTNASCTTASLYSTTSALPLTTTIYGIPSTSQRATDFHQLTLSQLNSQADIRSVIKVFHTLGDMTLAMGGGIGTPTLSSTSTPGYIARTAAFTMPVDYATASLAYGDGTNNTSVIQSAGYLNGALSVVLAMPNLSSVAGFQTSWEPQSGNSLSVTAVSNLSAASLCTEGATIKSATYSTGSSLRQK